MIKVEVIADSVSPFGDRVTTMECTFHRFILPEFNTYRMWSRSAASSRAIPTKRRIDEVRDNPAMPARFGKNQRGMVAEESLEGDALGEAVATWLEASQAAADYAQILAQLNVAKELVNRVLEPFSWHTSVVTASDFQNCFNQRIPVEAGAQSEFQVLASAMKDALDSSDPEMLLAGEWHLPYISDQEKRSRKLEDTKKASVARVARTSYLKKEFDFDKDLDLYERLLSADPPHLAPFEMVATPCGIDNYKNHPGNLDGWLQLRHFVDGTISED